MSDFRTNSHSFLNALIRAPESELLNLARQSIAPDATWHVSHPVPTMTGPEAVVEGLILPLQRALRGVHRRDEIFIGGANRRSGQADDTTWVASTTHYVGNFVQPLFGVPPHNHVLFIRSGEIYQVAGGKITVAYLLIDFVELLRQAGHYPFPHHLGVQTIQPGPATHDGVLPQHTADGETAWRLATHMQKAQHQFDPETFSSARQTGPDGFWHDEMFYHGAGGIGLSYRWEGFVNDHRTAFLQAFPDRRGGHLHYCQMGDGNYSVTGGWPSVTMTHTGEYFGIQPTNKEVTLRTMDFYRVLGGQIRENWLYLDLVDLFRQVGVDVFELARIK